MGRPKLLLPLGETTVLEHVIACVRRAGVEQVVVVIAPGADALAEIATKAGAQVVQLTEETPDMRATCLHGLAWIERHLQPTPEDAWLLLPADHPTVDANIVEALLEAATQGPATILVPAHQGRRGHPTLLRWSHVEGIRALAPDVGLNAYIRQHADETRELPWPSVEVLRDLDTPEDYARLQPSLRYLDLTLPSVVENLALDEALLEDAEAGGPEVLRFWEWPTPAVVLGAGSRVADDVHVEACDADGVPITRRSSGGGTVLLNAGCLLFSLVLRFERNPALGDLHASYRFILGRIAEAISGSPLPLGEGRNVVALEGTSDLAMGERKFSGNAQQRKRTHLLHHGSLLYAFDFALLERYLKLPARRPAYRRDRSHVEFLMNLPFPVMSLKARFRDVWAPMGSLEAWPKERVQRLVQEKYLQRDWIRRR